MYSVFYHFIAIQSTKSAENLTGGIMLFFAALEECVHKLACI